jgi:glc operon protein GlcG
MNVDKLTLEGAQELIARALAKAKADFHRPICVAICDASGFLVAFARMDGSPIRSIEISQNKAFTAVRMGVPTDKFRARLQQDQLEASYFGERLIPLPGGNPLLTPNGELLGAIGISGLALGEDKSISEALSDPAELAKL